MPDVRVTETHIVQAAPGVNVTYSPAERVKAPDAHIDEIVAAGRGDRLTSRGKREAVADDDAGARADEAGAA